MGVNNVIDWVNVWLIIHGVILGVGVYAFVSVIHYYLKESTGRGYALRGWVFLALLIMAGYLRSDLVTISTFVYMSIILIIYGFIERPAFSNGRHPPCAQYARDEYALRHMSYLIARGCHLCN